MALDDTALARFRLPAHRQHYYGGAWHAPLGQGRMEITSPATSEALGSAAVADATDVARAVEAARAAFEVSTPCCTTSSSARRTWTISRDW
jgi:betaine-aldehyde dehydrogenase